MTQLGTDCLVLDKKHGYVKMAFTGIRLHFKNIEKFCHGTLVGTNLILGGLRGCFTLMRLWTRQPVKENFIPLSVSSEAIMLCLIKLASARKVSPELPRLSHQKETLPSDTYLLFSFRGSTRGWNIAQMKLCWCLPFTMKKKVPLARIKGMTFSSFSEQVFLIIWRRCPQMLINLHSTS